MENKRYLLTSDTSIAIVFGDKISEEVNQKINVFNKLLAQKNVSGIVEAVPTYCTLMVHYQPEAISYTSLINIFDELLAKIDSINTEEKQIVEIPVLYGGELGPDLDNIAKLHNKTIADVIKIHSEREYLIYMLGFTPGFPYLGGMSKEIAAPRLEKPRVKIEAGSIGIAGEQTGIYPISSPGGWQIIGRTPLKLFDVNREQPILLKAGQYIRFVPIDKEQFDSISEDKTIASIAYEKNNTKADTANSTQIENGIKIINGGLLTTVQDLGRYRYQEFGVPVAGAMDLKSCRLANLLVDNEENEAVLEATMLGPTIELLCDSIIAITGGDLAPQINGTSVDMYKALVCKKGDILSFAGIKSGSRAYIAFAGGLAVPIAMGSRSTYTKAKIGGYEGRRLQQNDIIRLQNPKKAIDNLSNRFIPNNTQYTNEITLRVTMGPQEDYFTEKGIEAFLNSTYTITNEFDRMGCRLEGETIEHKKDGNIISDGIAFGAVQIPSHGKPIIMLADRQTVGGYTKIANVIAVDLPKLAQAKPADKVRFISISIDEAQGLYIDELEKLKAIKKKLLAKTAAIKGQGLYKIYVNNKTYDVSIEEL